MKRALLLLLALASLGLAACAGSGPGYSPGTGAAGTGVTGAAGTTGAAGGPPACQVNILPIVPASFEGLVAGPAASARVRGQVTGLIPQSYGWRWTVTLADGSLVAVTTVNRDDESLVEFPMASAGTYTMVVELTGGTHCMGVRTILAARPAAKVATFRLRVTPPSTELVPAQELVRQVIGGTPSGGNVLALEPGLVVDLDVRRGAGGAALPSYVRLTEATSGAVLERRTTPDGQNFVRVARGSYGMVVIPDGDVAPVTFPPRALEEIAVTWLDDGTMVTGTVVDAADKPLAGATVVLRAGDLVSTTGTTDDKGTFRLRARAGTFGLTVVSSLAGGTLESKLASTPGVLVGGTSAPPLGIKIQAAALATATVKLSAKDALSVTPETRVTLSAMEMEPLMGVASIAVGAAAPRAMTSNARLTLHPQADGTLSTGPVPRGRYLMTVFPATANGNDGVTNTIVDLTAGDSGPLDVPLKQKVKLRGRLGPMNATMGVRLVALDEGGLPVVAEGNAGADGFFAIDVSPMRRYRLRALPRPDQPLARASFPPFTVAATDYAFGEGNMPPALLYAGRVVDPSLQGVGTALVQAFCAASAPGCADPTTPVAETVTRTDGTFQLMLPDPDGTP